MSSPPIMVRAALTPDEWAALRKLAIDRKITTAALVANLLRAGLANEARS